MQNRRFRWFLASWTAATVGYSVYSISIVWLAYTVSRSFLVVGAALFIETALYTVVFLFGPIADRVRDQRTIYLATYPLMGAAAVALGVGALRGLLDVPLLLGLIAFISALWDLAWAAGNAAPGLLLTKDEQFAGQGVSAVVSGVTTIAGYASGGVLILLVGPGGGMVLYGALLVAAAGLAVPLSIPTAPSAPASWGASLREGWARIVAGAGRPLLQFGTVDAVEGFFGAVPALLITLFATTAFATSGIAYSGLYVTYVVGSTVSGLALGRWNPRSIVGVVLVVTLLGVAGTFALFWLLPEELALLAGAFLLLGFLTGAYLDVKYALFRGIFAPGELGRLISNMYLFPGIAASVGALVLGSLADRVTPELLALTAAAGYLAAGLLGILLPAVRRLRF